MKLDLEQSKHLAGTSRVASIGLFGLYGFPYLSGKGGPLGFLSVAIRRMTNEQRSYFLNYHGWLIGVVRCCCVLKPSRP